MRQVSFPTMKLIACSLFIMVACHSLRAQTKNEIIVLGDSSIVSSSSLILTGVITVGSTGQPLAGAHLHVDGLLGGTADGNGKYVIAVKRGENRVAIRHVSMAPEIYKIFVYQTSVFNIEMSEKIFELQEIVINAQELDANVRQNLAGSTLLKAAEIKSMPALAGEADVVKTLQYLPGVTSVGEGSAGVNVRGGRTDQNLMLLDDALLLGTNHAIGFLSPYNADAVENFTLYKGTMPSAYGGRTSSTLNVEMRKGNFEAWRGNVTPGTSVSKLMVEGPLVKNKVSLLMGGKISNTNWLLKEVKDANVSSSTIQFHDTYTNVAFKINPKNSIDVNLLTTGDYFRFSNQYGYEWSNLLTSIRLKNLLSSKSSVVSLFAYGKLQNSFFDTRGTGSAIISNGISYFQAKSSYLVTWKSHAVSLGAETIFYSAAPEQIKPYSGSSSVLPNQVSKDQGQELAFFVSDEWNPTDWFSASAGIRYSGYFQRSTNLQYQYAPNRARIVGNIVDTLRQVPGQLYQGIEPRFSARINLSKIQSIKLGFSRVYQYLHAISNTTAPTPVDLWQVSTKYILPQQSDNYSIGYFKNAKNNAWSLSAEFFYRQSINQLEYKDFASLYLNDHIETEVINAIGEAYGVELQAKRNVGKWTGWLAYTFSRSFAKANGPFAEDKINQGQWFAANQDRPHVASLVINKRFWPSGSFNMTASYTTGRPLSIIDAYYSVNGSIVPNYSNRNEYRIPDYFRLDIAFTIGSVIKKIDDSLVIGVYNLFGFQNAYSVYYQRFQNQSELAAYKLSLIGSPLPSITYSIIFK